MPFFLSHIQGTNNFGDQFHMGFGVDSGAVGESSAQVVADKIADVFIDKWTTSYGGITLQGQYPPGAKFEKAVVYERPRTAGGPSTELAEADLGPLTGTSGSATLPPEIAVCVSLLTNTAGRSGRGRMYLPAPVVATSDNKGLLSTGQQDMIKQWAAAFFGGINTQAGTDLNCVVWSRKTGQTHSITRVSVGNQFDVQRRRQNSLPETYLTSDVSQV